MNVVCLTGHLTADPKLNGSGASEYSFVSFSIANNDEQRKQADGTYQDVVSFINAEWCTKNPQYWLDRMRKGIKVSITGRLKQDRWEQDGATRTAIKVHCTAPPELPPKAQDGTAPPAGFPDDIPF